MAMRQLLHPDEYEVSDRSSAESSFRESFDIDDADYASYPLTKPYFLRRKRSLLSRLTEYVRLPTTARPPARRRLVFRRIAFLLHLVLGIVAALAIVTFLFRPSYTYLPPHYRALRSSIQQSQAPGRGNPHNEKVFIAINLYDKGGHLARGRWAQAVSELVELLGEHNTYLSVYENDAGEEAERALGEFDERIKCNKSIVFEEHFDFADTPTVTLSDGSVRKRRVPYLAGLRNKVLQPLDGGLDVQFDKLLYMNDVYFDPVDVIQLLFSTNQGEDGLPHYRAACAVDFGNLLKFYDSFAVRDSHGYPIGVPFFPWFTSAGAETSRQDVLAQKDAVRVRSCWGGIVAFDAKYFQRQKTVDDDSRVFMSLADRRNSRAIHARNTSNDGPVRFRAISDMYWEASESCLIHADIQEPFANIDDVMDTEVYMNPYIRVSYDYQAFTWLGFVRRFERLFILPNWIANIVSGQHPAHNSRRTDIAGEEVEQRVWHPDASYADGGYWVNETRVAERGGFCARRDLFVLITDRKEGQNGWEPIRVPRDPESRDWIQPM